MAGFDAEMQRALEADGDKLAALTGEDHGPVFVLDEHNAAGLNPSLLAAAPEMLEALLAWRSADKAQAAYEARCALPGSDDRDEALDDLGVFALERLADAVEKRDAAIAKAEGRT